jgi:predicted nucleic acid-binding protein
MIPLFADAFFFIALLNSKDRAHDLASLHVEPDLEQPFLTTTWVLAEVADAMASTARNRAAFADLYRLLARNPAVEIISADLWMAHGLDLYTQRPDKGWSLTDCISFVVMADRGLTDALTGDHHFEQAGFRALLRNP